MPWSWGQCAAVKDSSLAFARRAWKLVANVWTLQPENSNPASAAPIAGMWPRSSSRKECTAASNAGTRRTGIRPQRVWCCAGPWNQYPVRNWPRRGVILPVKLHPLQRIGWSSSLRGPATSSTIPATRVARPLQPVRCSFWMACRCSVTDSSDGDQALQAADVSEQRFGYPRRRRRSFQFTIWGEPLCSPFFAPLRRSQCVRR